MIIQEFNTETIDENDYLWRFLNIEKFLSMVLNHKLHFTRLDQFEDLQEGIFPSFLLFNKKKETLSNLEPHNELSRGYTIDWFPNETDAYNAEFEEIQKSHYANCWYLSKSNIESAAMWNLYSQPNSVALRIQYKQFQEKIKNDGFQNYDYYDSLTLGKVKYFDFQDTTIISQIKEEKENSVFYKHISFNHESEFRIVIKSEYEKDDRKDYKKGISKKYQDAFHKSLETNNGFDIELQEFLDYKFEIVFHPKISAWVKEDLKKIISEFNIPFNSYDSVLKLK